MDVTMPETWNGTSSGSFLAGLPVRQRSADPALLSLQLGATVGVSAMARQRRVSGRERWVFAFGLVIVRKPPPMRYPSVLERLRESFCSVLNAKHAIPRGEPTPQEGFLERRQLLSGIPSQGCPEQKPKPTVPRATFWFGPLQAPRAGKSGDPIWLENKFGMLFFGQSTRSEVGGVIHRQLSSMPSVSLQPGNANRDWPNDSSDQNVKTRTLRHTPPFFRSNSMGF